MQDIAPAERLIFAQERERIETGAVLDIGIGTGRTTAWLAPRCTNYIGVDYSPSMIAYCRKRFSGDPSIAFILADATSISLPKDHAFEFILFSFNGIDYVDHTHRLRILREIRNHLARDGIFVFSAHNRSYAHIQRSPRFLRPLRLRGIVRTGLEIANHLSARRSLYACDDYELINDPAHLFGLVTYYIDRRAQIAQLEKEGFRVLRVVDRQGRIVSDGDDETISPDFHYVTECGR